MPLVWLQAAITLCPYTGFKAIDDFSLYANHVAGLEEVNSARASVVSLWVHPIAAVGAGYLSDRGGAVPMTMGAFVLLAVAVSCWPPASSVQSWWIFLLTIVRSSTFTLQGLYHASMRYGRVLMAFTGFALGLVLSIGYTPDLLMGPLMGYLRCEPATCGSAVSHWPGLSQAICFLSHITRPLAASKPLQPWRLVH
jgi:hypothetical protein